MIDIKRKLIEEIEKIDDKTILHQLTELLSDSNDSIEIEFTPGQISQINDSQNQIMRGEFKTHEDVMKHFEND